MKTLTAQNKPWLKAHSGKLYIDTSHPEWQKWFAEEIKRIMQTVGYKRIAEGLALAKNQRV